MKHIVEHSKRYNKGVPTVASFERNIKHEPVNSVIVEFLSSLSIEGVCSTVGISNTVGVCVVH